MDGWMKSNWTNKHLFWQCHNKPQKSLWWVGHLISIINILWFPNCLIFKNRSKGTHIYKEIMNQPQERINLNKNHPWKRPDTELLDMFMQPKGTRMVTYKQASKNFLKFFLKKKKDRTVINSWCEIRITLVPKPETTRNSISHTNHERKYNTPWHDAKITGRTLITAAQHCTGILGQAARRQSE